MRKDCGQPPSRGGMMMRFDIQAMNVREALRYARYDVPIRFNEKLTVREVERRDQAISETRCKAYPKRYRADWRTCQGGRIRA